MIETVQVTSVPKKRTPGAGTDKRVDQRPEMLKEFSPRCGEVNRLRSFIAREGEEACRALVPVPVPAPTTAVFPLA